jgi:two-component system CheB/CheR fusion protein
MMKQKSKQIDLAAPSQPTGALDLPTTTPMTGVFPVVGLVGAAGSRLALEKFFRTLPTDTGMTFVVVTRLAAKEQRLLLTALQARTDLPVLVATEGVLLENDQVYLVPSGLQPTVEQGRLHLQPIAAPAAHRRFDSFLISLAVEQGANAVALLLSGAGEDGIAGLQAIKTHGGLVAVQDPNEAAHPALPRRGVATGLADCVDKAGEVAQWLVQTRGDLANLSPSPLHQDDEFLQSLPALLAQIAGQTGHDLSHYKHSTLQRRMLRRMRNAGVSSLLQYLDLLKANVLETVALFRDCLVSVTSFFRDPDAYEMLARDCIPQLFQGKGRSDLVRVWVAGCATGEEAYSVAMQLAERAAQVNEPPRWQLFATDLDEAAIAIARRGLYPTTIAKDIAPGRIQRYFIEENGYYRVKPEIRENILFAAQDLLQDPPFSRVDLICCRNVLIYFTRPAQEKLFATFHYALNPSGYLFLGASESIDAANDLFAVLNKQCHLYQRRNITLLPPRRPPNYLIPAPSAIIESKATERPAPRPTEKPRTLEELYAAWSLRVHTPPRLLVNQNYEITHLFGGAERYLQTRDGAVTQHVLQRIHPDLRLELRAALYQAFNQRERTISRPLPVTSQQRTTVVQLQVGPVTETGFPADTVEVVLVPQENGTLPELEAPTERKVADLTLVSRLEEELLRTRERLQQIIEEYETAGQELKVSNEELQSINEELKSTTEELETSKEELQSMNEELTTVNGELTRKIEELHRANSDLLNLISSTEVGAIFLNQGLQINRFTPRATDLFNLIEGDIGRPFAHVTHRLRHGGLPALAAQVLVTNGHVEETLQRDDNRWFMLRLFPYRTVTGEYDGVVITFIDIHDLKRAESEERQRRQQQSLAELSRQALTGVDLDTFLTAVTHRVAEVLDMELCKVLELQPGGKALLLKAGIGWQEGLVGQATVSTDTGAQAGYTLQSQAPVVVRDLQTETRFSAPALLLDHDVRSGVSVTIAAIEPSMAPALTGADAYGVLGVHSRQVRAFTPYDVDYLQSVANLLAATIARRRAEAALRLEEERYRFIFNSVGVSIWEEDFTGVQALIDRLHRQGVSDLRAHLAAHPALVEQAIAAVRIYDVNQYSLAFFGATNKGQLLASLERVFVPETQAIFVEELLALAAGERTYQAETMLQTLQGAPRHVLFTITFPAAGRLDRVLVSIVDITERKAAEAEIKRLNHALKQRVDELQTLLDVAPIGIFVAHDPEGREITGNPAGARMLAIDNSVNASKSSPQGEQLPFRILQAGREVPPEDLPMQYAMRHNVTITNQEYVIVRQDGSVINLYEYAVPLHDEAGQVRGGLGIFVDITERKQAEDALHALTVTLEERIHERTMELERSNYELDQFAYVASHDLKAPLRAIINLAGWIAEDAGAQLPAASQEHLQKLHRRALRMDRLLDDLLIYSRLDRRSDAVEPVQLDRLIQDIVELLAPPPGFSITTSGALPQLTTVRAPLELVLRNLINNAVKHHHQPAQGVVTITVQETDAFVEFAIRDNGPGIDPQHHERIFGMFQTLRPRDEVEGSGMGLALVKKAVKQRKGSIRLTSAPDQGTTFFFTWPKTVSTEPPVQVNS